MKSTMGQRIQMVLAAVTLGVLIWACPAKGDFIFGEPSLVPNINMEASWAGSPHVTRDGLEMYFVSNRAGETGDTSDNIWVSRRLTTDTPWSEPVKLPAPINTTGPESFPCVSPDGLELYFSSGYDDLWVATRASKDDPWEEPTLVPAPIYGSFTVEYSLCLSADGLEMYFASDRPGGGSNPTNTDIFVATRATRDDPWGDPVKLGPNVNGPEYENTPFISADGLSLTFSRGYSKGHVFVCRRATKDDPWGPTEFISPVNSGSPSDIWSNSPGEAEYSLCYTQADSMLYFHRCTSAWSTDHRIYQVEVTPAVDFNGDTLVDGADLAVLMNCLGTDEGACDISPIPFGDGVVDTKDLEMFYRYADEGAISISTPLFGSMNVDPNTSLEWTASEPNLVYDVYLGTSSADVDQASRENPLSVLVSLGQDANSYDPDGLLDPGRTYYWRIDEVNATSDGDIVPGMVRYFTTAPLPGLIENVVVLSSSSERGALPLRTVDGSGLDSHYTHSTESDTMWLSKAGNTDPTWILYEFDAIYPLNALWVWNYNDTYEYLLGVGFKDVTIEYSEDGQMWSLFGDVQFAQGTSSNDYGYNTTIDFGGVPAKYVRLTALSNWGGMGTQYGLSEVRFFATPSESDETEETNN